MIGLRVYMLNANEHILHGYRHCGGVASLRKYFKFPPILYRL